MDLKRLKEPFPETDIEWRVSRSGDKNGKIWCMVLAYITNRAIMDRLDDICGPQGWKNEYKSAPEGGILCGISIKYNDEWITKWDGAENTNVEAIKGGLSGAMKRAGVQWGIGRYLYGLTENFGKVVSNGKFSGTAGKGNERKYYKWDPPVLPEWALPDTQEKKKLAEYKITHPVQYELMISNFGKEPSVQAGYIQALDFINTSIND